MRAPAPVASAEHLFVEIIQSRTLRHGDAASTPSSRDRAPGAAGRSSIAT